jgi:hypothetical protein
MDETAKYAFLVRAPMSGTFCIAHTDNTFFAEMLWHQLLENLPANFTIKVIKNGALYSFRQKNKTAEGIEFQCPDPRCQTNDPSSHKKICGWTSPYYEYIGDPDNE